MIVSDLELLYDYGYWANVRVRDALHSLTPEEFTRSVAGSYGSVRNTLVHIMSAEWGWLDRCGGAPRGGPLKASDFPSACSLFEQWMLIEAHMRTFLAALHDDDLQRPMPFAFGGGAPNFLPLGQLLHHATVHGAHHRGQVALLLRSLGHAPGNFDILDFYSERARATTVVA